MGRSRAVSKISDEDPNQRWSKRKRLGSNAENWESTSYNGQGNNERKAALYHCNYCNKDISGKIRIKCVVCPDFDLCVECFSVGAEIYPHKANHHYRVMDNLAFPLICVDWNADEETLLVEGIGMYGFGNWVDVAEHVGTKTKAQCIDHYDAIYMNSPCFPIPDLSRVMGKTKDDLLAMAKQGPAQLNITQASSTVRELSPKEEPAKYEEGTKSSAQPSAETGAGSVSGKVKGETKMEEAQVDRSIGEKKLRMPGEEFSGYNFKRQEFEIEYDNDAEQLLADMEFKETDTDGERELKVRVLRIYSKRLDERKRRKEFILERNLLYPDPFEKSLSTEEKEIYQRFKVFARFHSREEHEVLLRSMMEEHHIIKRIEDLKEARAGGCRTATEASRFIEQKRKRENEENAVRIKENGEGGGQSGKFLQKHQERGGGIVSSKDPTLPTTLTQSLDEWDVAGFTGSDLLSETEKRLCSEIRILPAHYLRMVQTMSMQVLSGKVSKKSDAYDLFKVEPNKVDRVFDMLVKKGIIAQP